MSDEERQKKQEGGPSTEEQTPVEGAKDDAQGTSPDAKSTPAEAQGTSPDAKSKATPDESKTEVKATESAADVAPNSPETPANKASSDSEAKPADTPTTQAPGKQASEAKATAKEATSEKSASEEKPSEAASEAPKADAPKAEKPAAATAADKPAADAPKAEKPAAATAAGKPAADAADKPKVKPAPAAKATPAAAAGDKPAPAKKAPPKKEPPPPDPRTIAATEQAEKMKATIVASLGQDVVEEAGAAQYKPMLRIRKDRWRETFELLKQHEDWQFNYIEMMAGTDYPDYIEVVVYIYSTELKHEVLLKTRTDRENAEVPSIVSVHPGVNWEEREIYDLVGVTFTNHPDLRRIMMWEGFKGHPLRKDYTPWEGEEDPDVAE